MTISKRVFTYSVLCAVLIGCLLPWQTYPRIVGTYTQEASLRKSPGYIISKHFDDIQLPSALSTSLIYFGLSQGGLLSLMQGGLVTAPGVLMSSLNVAVVIMAFVRLPHWKREPDKRMLMLATVSVAASCAALLAVRPLAGPDVQLYPFGSPVDTKMMEAADRQLAVCIGYCTAFTVSLLSGVLMLAAAKLFSNTTLRKFCHVSLFVAVILQWSVGIFWHMSPLQLFWQPVY